MARTPKEEATDLLNMLLPLAEQMLRRYGEFYPYGGAMRPDGGMEMFGASDARALGFDVADAERPSSKKHYQLLETAFRHFAMEGRFKATGIVYDVLTLPPGATAKVDAIAVRLDHEAGYSVVVMIPYRIADGQITKGTIFATMGDGSVFPAKQ